MKAYKEERAKRQELEKIVKEQTADKMHEELEMYKKQNKELQEEI